jgi:putative flippase GtrA
MPVSPIITIIIGLLVAFVLPEWIKFGDKKNRQFVQLVINVIGILIAISGAISFIRAI